MALYIDEATPTGGFSGDKTLVSWHVDVGQDANTKVAQPAVTDTAGFVTQFVPVASVAYGTGGEATTVQKGWVLCDKIAVGANLMKASSVAAGNWLVFVKYTLNLAYTGSFQLGFRMWQVSADHTTATKITLPGATANGWVYSATTTPGVATSGTISINLTSVGAITLAAASPYLLVEFNLKNISKGTTASTLALGVQNSISFPAISYDRTSSDTGSVTSESATRSVNLLRQPSDSAPLSNDTTRRLDTLNRSATDSAPTTDAASRVQTVTRTLSDTASASDTATRMVALTRTPSDSAPFTSDAATRGVTLLRTPSDSAPTSDAATRQVVLTRTPSDSAPFTSDSAFRVAQRARTATDSAPTTDSAFRVIGLNRTGTDNAPVTSDTAVRLQNVARSTSDSAPVTDSATRKVALTRTPSDNAPVTDSAFRVAAVNRSASDSAPASDTASRVSTVARFATDSAPITDTSTRRVANTRTASDSAPITDSAARVQNLQRTGTDYLAGTPDYPVNFPTKTIAGTVYDHETGLPLTVVSTVKLYRDSDDKMVTSTISSAVNGSFSFTRDRYDPNTYHYTSEYMSGGTQVHGISDRGLVPA